MATTKACGVLDCENWPKVVLSKDSLANRLVSAGSAPILTFED